MGEQGGLGGQCALLKQAKFPGLPLPNRNNFSPDSLDYIDDSYVLDFCNGESHTLCLWGGNKSYRYSV